MSRSRANFAAPCLASLLAFAACTNVATAPADPLDAGEWRSAKSRMYQDLARQCLKAEDHDRARALLQQAVQFDPKDRSTLELLCRLAYAHGDHDTARGAALLLAALDPTSVAAACTLGAIAEATDQPAVAEAHYRQALAVAGNDPRPGIDLHRLLLAGNREPEAMQLRTDLVRRFPRGHEPAFDHGAWLAGQGRWSDASAAFAQALAQAPDDAAAATAFALATVLSRDGNRALELGTRLPPRARADNPPFALLLAIAWLQQGEAAQALRELDLALPACGKRPRLHLLRGELLAELGHRDAAQAAFDRALELDPDQAQAHAGLGRLHLAAGRHHAAVRAFEQAVRLQPGSAVAHALLAGALLATGETAAASSHVAIARQDPAAHELVAELERLAAAVPAGGGKR